MSDLQPLVASIRWPAVAILALCALARGDGTFVKPCFNVEEVSLQWVNSKVNATTRGAANALDAHIFMMEPPLNHTGQQDVIGFRTIMQDEEARTQEACDFSFVKYAADGVSPDESVSGTIFKTTIRLFGFGLSGRVAYDFLLTTGRQMTLPTNHGIGLKIPAHNSWPVDGASIHGQLNLPWDPLQPRISPPYDQQAWAFERPPGQTTAQPLGGRFLDTLLITTVWINDPLLQHFVVSNAYTGSSGQPEKLFGPESMHPEAARGDALGFRVQGGNDGVTAVGMLFLAPALAANPFQLSDASGNNWVYLAFAAPFPILLDVGTIDPTHGRWETTPIPFSHFPVGLRDFWVQCMIVYPVEWQLRLTDCVGVKGL